MILGAIASPIMNRLCFARYQITTNDVHSLSDHFISSAEPARPDHEIRTTVIRLPMT